LHLRGGPTEKRPKNSTFKPLSTIFVARLKIQGGPRPPLPTPMVRGLISRHAKPDTEQPIAMRLLRLVLEKNCIALAQYRREVLRKLVTRHDVIRYVYTENF